MSATTASPVKKLLARLSATLTAALAAAAATPALASHFFNTPASYATGPAAATSPVTDGFTTSSVLTYNSYAQFAADLTSHAITPAYTWVMYDPEYWSATPLPEQQNPAAYMQE